MIRLLRTVLLALTLLSTVGCATGRPPTPLRVMTYNIKHGMGMDGEVDLERIAAVIRAEDPDVVALQEVDENCARSGNVDQAAALAAATGLEHHAFGPFMDYDGGRYGMAILSRRPITTSAVIDLPPGQHEPRTALAATIRVHGQDLQVVGVHLDWLADDADRFAQAEVLVDRFGTWSTASAVILGDFNDEPGSRTIARFQEPWREAAKPDDAAWTFPADEPEREIDFIFVRARPERVIIMGAARVVPEPVASDHRPVVANLLVN